MDFFALSKILGFFAIPSNALVALGLLGIVALLRWRRLGAWMLSLSVIGTGVIGLSPLGNVLMLPLEERFSRSDSSKPVAGIVVLGGAIDTIVAGARGELNLNEAAERVTAVAGLARLHPEARIIFSGGSGTLLFDGANEAEVAARLFSSFGIDPARVVNEGRARNTHENAVYAREIADPQSGERWLLVTSAFHMPRSMGAFRKAGFAIEPFPVDYRTRGWEDVWRPFRAVGEGARRTDMAVREWVGLVAYYYTGKTDALLPGP